MSPVRPVGIDDRTAQMSSQQAGLRDREGEASPDVRKGRIAAYGVVLSGIEYWTEDRTHVVRSTDYDVIASGDDERAAIDAFVEASVDYARFLWDPAGDPTDDDRALANMIMDRLFEGAARALDHETRRRLIVRVLRHRGAGHSWRLQRSPLTS